MDHLAGYGTDSEGEEVEEGGRAEAAPIQQQESPEEEGDRGERLKDAFDDDFESILDVSAPSSSTQGRRGELVEPKPPRRYSEAENGGSSGRSPNESDLDMEETNAGSARSDGMRMDTPETPKSTEACEEEALEQEFEEISVKLPPSPPGECDPDLERRFLNYFDKKSQGVQINEKIKGNKGFKNPAIYEFLVNKYGIDEKGSNFSKDIFDPHGFDESDYYDALGEQQKKLHDKLNSQGGEKRPAPGIHHSTTKPEPRNDLHDAGQRQSRFDRRK